MPIFQPSMMKSSSSSRARGGGDTRSLTPRCSATPIKCVRRRFMDTTTTRFKQVCVPLLSSCLSVELMWSARDAEDAGSAKRGNDGHATSFGTYAPGRDSTPRSPKGTDEGQKRERGACCTSRPSSGRGRPAPLPEVAGWQERIQRRTGEQMIDDLPSVQILDAPVPQVVDSAMEFFRDLDLPVAEQVIDVPIISSSSCSSRAVLREPQMAEQLMDVPIQHLVELLLQHPVDFQVESLAEVNKVFSLWTGFGRRADR